jgi:hypothetical protein
MTDAGLRYFLLLTAQEQVDVIRKMARQGVGDHTIATATTADHAARLIQRFEVKLVPLTGKTPNGGFGWNTDENLIGTVEAARAILGQKPNCAECDE